MIKAGTYLTIIAAALMAAVSCTLLDAITSDAQDPQQQKPEVSPYDKNVDFGFVPAAYYIGQQNFLSLTFEGFNGFPHDTVYSENAKKANSELLGNYLATLCGVLGGRQDKR